MDNLAFNNRLDGVLIRYSEIVTLLSDPDLDKDKISLMMDLIKQSHLNELQMIYEIEKLREMDKSDLDVPSFMNSRRW